MDVSQNQIIHRISPDQDYPFHMSTKNFPMQIRHNPHPFHVRHVKGFLGLPTQLVETENDEAMAARRTVEQFVKDSLKRGDWNYKKESSGYVKKSKDLDSILALQYFTGLQSYSFKQDYLPYLGYREYFCDWRKKLRNITEATYQPFLDIGKNVDEVIPEIQHPNEWINGQKLQKRSKSMYSKTGRLVTRESKINTCSTQRPKSNATKFQFNELKPGPNFNELDAVIFLLLADLLQTQSVDVIQTWLSRSTERERALITSMLQASISKPSLEMETEVPKTRMKTSEFEFKMKQKENEIRNKTTSTKMEESNVLIVESNTDCKKEEEIRPPTSSTFKTFRAPADNSARDSKLSMWSQYESIKK